MGDTTRGLYNKFRIERVDGSSAPGGKHEGCQYFVLDLNHDPHALPALLAYAESCRNDYPMLTEDLTNLIEMLQKYPVSSNRKENLTEALQKERQRVQDLLRIYEAIPTGALAAIMMRHSLACAERAAASGDVIAMLTACKDLERYDD